MTAPKVTTHVQPELKAAMRACGLHPGHCLEVGIKYMLTADREACMDALDLKVMELREVRDNLKRERYSL